MSGKQAVLDILQGADELLDAGLVAAALGFPRFEFLQDARRRGLTLEGDPLKVARADVRRVYYDGASPSDPGRWTTTAGGVYFVRCRGFVKIGVAANLDVRLAAFALYNPDDVELLLFRRTASQAAAFKLEAALHFKFKEHRHRGEWYRDCPEIGAFITTERHG